MKNSCRREWNPLKWTWFSLGIIGGFSGADFGLHIGGAGGGIGGCIIGGTILGLVGYCALRRKHGPPPGSLYWRMMTSPDPTNETDSCRLEWNPLKSHWFGLGIFGGLIGADIGVHIDGIAGGIGGFIIGGTILGLVGHFILPRNIAPPLADPYTEMKNLLVETWREIVGICADEMAVDREEAKRQLMSADPNIRRAALEILNFVWNVTGHPDFVRRCEEIATNDPDSGVRRAAARILGQSYRRTRDPSIGKFFAEMVLDEARPLGVRTDAYYGLLEIREIRFPRGLQFPENVDWDFVRSFTTKGV